MPPGHGPHPTPSLTVTVESFCLLLSVTCVSGFLCLHAICNTHQHYSSSSREHASGWGRVLKAGEHLNLSAPCRGQGRTSQLSHLPRNIPEFLSPCFCAPFVGYIQNGILCNENARG